MDLSVADFGVVDFVLPALAVVFVSTTTPLGRTFPAEGLATPLGSSFPRPRTGDFIDFVLGDMFFLTLDGVPLAVPAPPTLDFPSPNLSVNRGFLFGGGLLLLPGEP